MSKSSTTKTETLKQRITRKYGTLTEQEKAVALAALAEWLKRSKERSDVENPTERR